MSREGSPTLQRIRDEVGWDPFDGEPTDDETLERYVHALESQVRAGDMIAGRWIGGPQDG